MTKWIDIEFADVPNGMASNPINPGQKTAQRILNLQNNAKPGALVLRPGYEQYYAAPTCPIVDNSLDDIIEDEGIFQFDVFYDKQANAAGQEVHCLMQKATVHGLTDVSETQEMPCFWIRPYWNGSQWVDSWQWLNQTIITKIITGSDGTYPNMIIVAGSGTNGITDNSLNKFTIYNKTKDEYAKIITSKVSGGYTRICHTLYNSTWEVDDVIVISRNWIDLAYLTELYSIEWQEVAYHKTLNDLRIGFGGQANRPGLCIGYRNKYFQLKEFSFTNIHSDMQEAGVLEAFSTIDEVILDTHILNETYQVSLVTDTGGDLPAGDYTVRLTGIIDTYEEQLLAEVSTVLDDESQLEILPYVNIGTINPRITGFGVYYSSDNATFYKLFKYNIKEDSYSEGNWIINADGRLILISTIETEGSDDLELHTEANAASASDTNTLGSWIAFGDGTIEVTTDAQDTYAIKYTTPELTAFDPEEREGIIFPIASLQKNTYYEVSAYLKSSLPRLYSFILGASGKLLNRTQTEIIVTPEYVQYSFDVFADNFSEAPTHIVIAVNPGRNIFLSINGGGVYRSTDESSWEAANNGLPSVPYSDYYMVVNLGSMTLAANGDIYQSDNSGDNWTAKSVGTDIITLVKMNSKIYAGAYSGEVFRSDDNGENFSSIGTISTPLYDFANLSTTLFARSIGSGVFRSTNDGVTWAQANTGLTDSDVFAIFSDGTYVFAGTRTAGIFRSDDGGDNWTAKNTGLTPVQILDIKKSGSYLFVCDGTGGNGIFRSSDDGDNWTAKNSGLTTLNIQSLYVFGTSVLAGSSDGRIFKTTDNGETWNEVDTLPGGIFFGYSEEYNDFSADLISIKEKNNTVFTDTESATTEMTDELGYVPTMNLVRGWDQVINLLNGRNYYLNPYIDKRYVNFLLVSHIAPGNVFMYDISTFGNFRELEGHDGNKVIAIMSMGTNDILILKDSSLVFWSDDGLVGSGREPIYGISLAGMNSVANINGVIFFCGNEDAYLINAGKGLSVNPLLKETIRNLYLAIEDKDLIQGIRGKYNTYRIRIYDAVLKTEYVLSENGWVEEKKANFAEIYRNGYNNVLYFLSDGKIFVET